jgi:hypothetical protein
MLHLTIVAHTASVFQSILYEAKRHSQRLPVASLFEQGMLTERREGSVQLTSTLS